MRLAFAGGQLEEATPGRPQHRRLVSGYISDISGKAELLKEASAVSIDLGSKVLFQNIQITGALYGTIIA